MVRPPSAVKLTLEDDDEKFECDFCSDTFRSKTSIRTHMYRHYSDGVFTCFRCPSQPVFYHSKFIERHHKVFHAVIKPFKCEHCPAKYRTKSRLDSHVVAHSNDRPFACSYCDKRFKRKQGLTSHIENVHHLGPQGNRPILKCDICGKEFHKKNSLTRHLYLHYPDGQYVCDACDKVFEHSAVFKVHKRICGRPSVLKADNPRYHCEWCDKNFLTKFRYESHVVVHSADRNFSCTQCPKRFKRKRHLRLHTRNMHEPKKRTVSPTKPLKRVKTVLPIGGELSCAACSKIFQDHESFSMHNIIFHNPYDVHRNAGRRNRKDQPFYQCAHCDAAFKHKCRLRDHMLKHFKVRNVKCEYCKKRFKSKIYMRKHYDTHLDKQQKVVLLIMCDEKFEKIIRQEVRIFRVHETVDAHTTELERLIV